MDFVKIDPEPNPTRVLPAPVELSQTELASLNRLPAEGQESWFREHGSVELDWLQAQVILRGNSEHKVRITEINAVKQCSSPFDGTLFYSPPGGADDDVIRLGFDLDQPDSRAQLMTGWSWKGDYFDQKTISLVRGEDIVLQFVTTTAEHYCSFSFAVNYLVAGRPGTLTIDDHGKPFRLNALIKDMDDFPYGDYRRYRSLYVGGLGDPTGKHPEWVKWRADDLRKAENARLSSE
ncbi:hypothetical protein ACFYUV_34450 [Nonomuraea sp. NPDC003560]|uniref:hypothetical protein n=1 Tax=Nonomuraea sp. NPDC003560 TaxID=3364341 RepID=UPI003683C56F